MTKDLEKDELEAMERLARGRDMNQQVWIARGWSGASHFFGPRLQQVEAENARLKDTLSLACEEAERKGITAGETILRAVADIEMAVEGFCEDLVCPFRCGWDELLKPDAHADECPITLAKQLLQAKEEGTND